MSKEIKLPEPDTHCWDTAAYPELRDAIHEALAWSGCSVCKPATAPEKTVKEIMEFVRHYAANTFSSATLEDKIRRSLAAPATAPDERVKELEAELAATETVITEYRQQCLDNATEIARLRSESEERLQNCAALVAENEQLRWAVKDALAQLQRGDFADAESTLSVTAMKETP